MIINFKSSLPNHADLHVLFPYPYIYPEQYAYMTKLLQTYENAASGKSQCMIEMPTGTGKTACLLSLTIAWLSSGQQIHEKLIFCSRTVAELDKVCSELKQLFDAYKADGNSAVNSYLAVILTSRKNLCINEAVHRRVKQPETPETPKISLDSQCYDVIMAKNVKNRCGFYDGYKREFEDIEDLARKYGENKNPIQRNSNKSGYSNGKSYGEKFSGVYSIDQLKEYGLGKKRCPYFMAKHLINRAEVVIYSYKYLLDPKIANQVSSNLNPKSIVIFDEAHNIDQVCLESMSVKLNTRILRRAQDSLKEMRFKVENLENLTLESLEKDYNKLVSRPLLHDDDNMETTDNSTENSSENRSNSELNNTEYSKINPFGGSSMLKADLDFFQKNSIPGRIRRPQHFFSMLNRLIEFMKEQMIEAIDSNGKDINPNTFLFQLNEQVQIDNLSLRCTEPRLKQILQVLKFSGEALESVIPLIYKVVLQ